MTTLQEQGGVDELARFVRQHARLFVLSGAGISTGSGIPDYRDEAGRWKRKPPLNIQEFLRSADVRKRYWARSMRGWPFIAAAQPNPGHAALAGLEASGHVHRLVTQNVDGLHQRAGSRRVIELHGSINQVVCLDCRQEVSRHEIQGMLEAANGGQPLPAVAAAPDGDADVEPAGLDSFDVPGCPRCDGILKPDVVFFGENVPRERVGNTMEALDQSDAVLVVGSSLMTYSGYRFCETAHRLGKPIAAVNLGQTRADHLFAAKVRGLCAVVLMDLERALLPGRPAA